MVNFFVLSQLTSEDTFSHYDMLVGRNSIDHYLTVAIGIDTSCTGRSFFPNKSSVALPLSIVRWAHATSVREICAVWSDALNWMLGHQSSLFKSSSALSFRISFHAGSSV